ncbi:Crp/Fnr family transcriptional regulator [Citreimonas salinaria]|uniref:cAMP-binding domain of CRP or a regulatory subunit of cAMP-dependent protein kinases n=1 Tax=Citreimonas salinaria TaxID=321339 RepID=A0A1H3MUP3_9RHOB|nr:Crp/Fnr family transcriptional regulator [Citreimonas salinaria]SDY80158.1 cAMP-binding domain of CRP or a regulatory subunit of cAMP-dependent protein kinases [Citreimonas salinaria]
MDRRRIDMQILARNELFAKAEPEVVAAAYDMATEQSLAAGGILFEQGAPARRLFAVFGGRVRLTQCTEDGQQVLIRYVGAGELAGFPVLADTPHYPVSATAVDAVRAIHWDGPAIRGQIHANPVLAGNAMAVLGRRYEQLQTRLRELATENVEHRLARTLVLLVEEAGERVPEGLKVGFPISQQELAEMAGTCLHTVSRTLTGWEAQGLVGCGRRRVLIRDIDGLRAVADS